ncbi:deoxyguanosinetriphosphate triphosphohydrolase [Desulfobotulus sp. H1]|uniref:Deoxyguanosinetriphosphate triphosphohydrolase-like protein n=1 Tax=Desulfobotulus pelophilus TaxID=2823377 RepID=A0ABT3NCH8_9BACT|nr:deoxyguanosinetriphosphate triphosphohydrolase [Desulfobotulus pelophilus]MCW7755169.1 deoxyguanosinetriphosphate triphosphohydrolase [Desulfobotulus pelophilus]
MSIREQFEERETGFIASYGCCVTASRGRRRPEESCPIRTLFQQDRDRIVFSNSFRRLKHKTQVFLSPMGDHYRTRLTHTLEVAEVARTIARALRLNEDLTEAVALAHDLGHTPFGHSGETVLKEIYSRHFSHAAQSLRVVDLLEKKGAGLNLTYEVRDGILKHSKGFGNIIPTEPGETAHTIEGRVVRIADIIAYLNHDLDDAVRSGVISRDEIPESCVRVLGETHSARSTTMIRDLIFNSTHEEKGFCLRMSDSVYETMAELRQFLFDNVYRSPKVHNEFVKAKKILTELFTYLMEDDGQLQAELTRMELLPFNPETDTREEVVCDTIASMTDRYALNLYHRIFMPFPQF